MNNYLTSIAARILNDVPSVRPRLGGRFEPRSVFVEDSLDSAKSFSRTEATPAQPDSKRETTEWRDSNSEPETSFERAPRLDHPATLALEVKSEATTTTNSPGERAPSSTTRAPIQQTIAESPRQNTPVEVRPVEKVTDLAESPEFRTKTLHESQSENLPELRFEERSDRSVRVHHSAVEVDSTPARALSPAITPSSAGEEKPAAAPAITREKAFVEREIETLVIREKAILDQSAQNQLPAAPVTVSSDEKKSGDSRLPTVVVQSRIAPLIERGPEPVQFNRHAIQPQPTIHVTIGRVEVRAIQSSQAHVKSSASTPVMNLDEYLKRRTQGNTR